MFYDPEFGFTQCEPKNQEVNNNHSKFDVNRSDGNDVHNNCGSNNNNKKCKFDVSGKGKLDDGHEEEERNKCKFNVTGTDGSVDDEEKVTNNSNIGVVDDEEEEVNGNDGGTDGSAEDEVKKLNNNNVGGNVDEENVMKKIDNDRDGVMKCDVGRSDKDEILSNCNVRMVKTVGRQAVEKDNKDNNSNVGVVIEPEEGLSEDCFASESENQVRHAMLKCGLLNVRSAVNKAPLLNDVIQANNLNVFIITETWVPSDAPNAIKYCLAPEGYSILQSHRGSSQGKRGGVGKKSEHITLKANKIYLYLGIVAECAKDEVIEKVKSNNINVLSCDPVFEKDQNEVKN
ncbi:hypothetical protein HELRODRAFT_162802 [Helobdella robusta]|uniref:Uncharacterized protein n=1 Tax=Helobdella robusta TaxID=6412 RepID=T1ET65_HELRO|nr:hypothetical protein HELRODRAFT_162802 [Helobdella robusta]ESN99283.1 hypothetical protein HELRODRAFT_162802 [Helobdella robusta]